MYIFQGQLAWFNATILVLGEGAAMVSLVFEAFFVDETLVEVFDVVSRYAIRTVSLFC